MNNYAWNNRYRRNTVYVNGRRGQSSIIESTKRSIKVDNKRERIYINNNSRPNINNSRPNNNRPNINNSRPNNNRPTINNTRPTINNNNTRPRVNNSRPVINRSTPTKTNNRRKN